MGGSRWQPGVERRNDTGLCARSKFVRGLSLAVTGAIALTTLFSALATPPASAQGWWPFGNDEPRRPPVPREPMRQPPPVPAPIPQQQGAAGGANWSTKNPICLQLEQRLLQEGQKGNTSRDQLPKLEADIRQVDRAFNVNASQLDSQCYETFLFTRTFKNSPRCKDLAREVEVAKRKLTDLEAQRQQLMGTAGRSYHDDIVRELARNNCGANYSDEARRRDGGTGGGGGFWSDGESLGADSWTPRGGPGVATYKTVCVRLCDGYYFPLSFSTLPSHFPQDAETCSSKCAAPTQLFYHPNPGGSMDQAVSLQSNEPYTNLKAAFRYRKEYVNGCSCKEAEYVPAATADQKADSGTAKSPKTSAAAVRRAGDPAPSRENLTTGSTSEPTEGWSPQPQ